MREDRGIKAFIDQGMMTIWNKLPSELNPNTIYYVKEDGKIKIYQTDEQCKPRQAVFLPESSWEPIETIPHSMFVEVYSEDFERTEGPGSKSGGITICHYQPPTDKFPELFFDLAGLRMFWSFSHWRHIRPNPHQELGDE